MKSRLSTLAIAVAVVFLVPAALAAQGKIRIAIWEFENHAERSWWFHGDMGPAARNHIDTAFSENATLSKTFSVIERDKLAMVLKEQGLATTGAVDPQTAAKVGKILGVKYVLTGGIDKFAVNTTGGAIGRLGVGGRMVQANATVNVRLIDTTTAERVLSVAADAEVKRGGGSFRGTSLSREAEWGIASEAIQRASGNLIEKLVQGNYLDRISAAAAPAGGLEGKVVKVDGQRAWINLGSTAGLKVGDTFAIIAVGEELIDPDTGIKLGADEKETGTGQVSEIQEKFAIITFQGTATARDVVRKK
jgi:curli biogenesis system outer membrane secretion channel CsgG